MIAPTRAGALRDLRRIAHERAAHLVDVAVDGAVHRALHGAVDVPVDRALDAPVHAPRDVAEQIPVVVQADLGFDRRPFHALVLALFRARVLRSVLARVLELLREHLERLPGLRLRLDVERHLSVDALPRPELAARRTGEQHERSVADFRLGRADGGEPVGLCGRCRIGGRDGGEREVQELHRQLGWSREPAAQAADFCTTGARPRATALLW